MLDVRLTCPECGDPLVRGDHSGIALDRCEACSGFWVKDSRLETLAAAVWRASATMRRLRAKVFIGRFAR